MSTIQHLFNRTLTVRRKQSLGGFKKDFSTVTASLDAHVQQGTSESTLAIYGIDKADYTGWVSISADVKKNDMIKDNTDGRIYMVVAVIEQGINTAMNEHQQIFMVEYPK